MTKKHLTRIFCLCMALACMLGAAAAYADDAEAAKQQAMMAWNTSWHEAMMRLEDERNTNFYDWTHQQRADFSQEYQLDTAKAAGLEADTVIYVMPPQGGIGEDEAFRIAKDIVMGDLNVGEEYFARMNVSSQCMTHGDPADNSPVWRIDVYPMNQTQEETPIHHVVEMDAMTGDITGGFYYNMNEANG